jgi:hypothetical protein
LARVRHDVGFADTEAARQQSDCAWWKFRLRMHSCLIQPAQCKVGANWRRLPHNFLVCLGAVLMPQSELGRLTLEVGDLDVEPPGE